MNQVPAVGAQRPRTLEILWNAKSQIGRYSGSHISRVSWDANNRRLRSAKSIPFGLNIRQIDTHDLPYHPVNHLMWHLSCRRSSTHLRVRILATRREPSAERSKKDVTGTQEEHTLPYQWPRSRFPCPNPGSSSAQDSVRWTLDAGRHGEPRERTCGRCPCGPFLATANINTERPRRI